MSIEDFGRLMGRAMADRKDRDISSLMAEPRAITRRLSWLERFLVLFGCEVEARFTAFEHRGAVVVGDAHIVVKRKP